MKRLMVTLCLLAVLEPIPALAASFDCRKASRPTEWLTCADKELSALDSKMGSIFADLRQAASGANRQAIYRGQLSWLTFRERACNMARTNMADAGDKARKTSCLLRETQERVRSLSRQFQQLTGKPHWTDRPAVVVKPEGADKPKEVAKPDDGAKPDSVRKPIKRPDEAATKKKEESPTKGIEDALRE